MNVGGASALVAACRAAGCRRVIAMSTQHVHLARPGVYGRTKRIADAIFLGSGLDVTLLRPSLVYGAGERGVFVKLQRLVRKLPVIPVILTVLAFNFLGRYLVLALLAVLILGLATIPLAFVWTATLDGPSTPDSAGAGFLWWVAPPFFVAMIAGTFVTPALAFSTRRVGTALRIGLRTILRTWPACVPYLVAPVVVGWATLFPAISLSARASLGSRAVHAVMTAVSSLALSSLIGATARMYLRRFPTGDDGAVPSGPEDVATASR